MRTLAAIALAALLAACAAACSSAAHPGSGAPAEGPAPDPKACRADADCRSGPLVNPDQPCCDTGVHRSVFGADYLAWRARWRAASCGGVECPVLPPPAPSLPCATEGRCVAGRCEDTCGGASPVP